MMEPVLESIRINQCVSRLRTALGAVHSFPVRKSDPDLARFLLLLQYYGHSPAKQRGRWDRAEAQVLPGSRPQPFAHCLLERGDRLGGVQRGCIASQGRVFWLIQQRYSCRLFGCPLLTGAV